MQEELRRLLERLERIGEEYPDLFNSEVRQAMSNALVDGFARLVPEFALPSSFRMLSAEGNDEVHAALASFLDAARPLAEQQELRTFHQRLAAIQNSAVRTDEGNDFDEFFGTSNPDFFDERGAVTRLM